MRNRRPQGDKGWFARCELFLQIVSKFLPPGTEAKKAAQAHTQNGQLSKISDLMTNSLQDPPGFRETSGVKHRRSKPQTNQFGRELHALLGVIGLKRSAFGERGYTYSLHKQICRGERPPSSRALASLKRLLDHRLEQMLTLKRGSHARLDQLARRLGRFDWLEADQHSGGWKVNVTALGRLWQPVHAPGTENTVPVVVEGTLTGLELARPASGAHPRLRLRHQRFVLHTTKSGQTRLIITLSRAEAERLREKLAAG